MPKRTDIKKVMVIGSGPIVIGQAAEFDYAGTQACLALKEEGYEVVLVNSNPATIQTDVQIADKVYMEPLTLEYVAKIVRYERPDAIVPGLGGQTGLNLAVQLAKKGVLQECQVEILGTSFQSIEQAEDRELFKELCQSLGEPVLPSHIAMSIEEAVAVAEEIGYPRSFTIYDTDDSQRVMKTVYKELSVDDKFFPVKSAINQMSRWKDQLVSPEQALANPAKDTKGALAARIYAAYEKRLKEAGAFDFDDLIYQTVQLLAEHPDVRDFYQTKYKYLLVDEYQDTSVAQFRLVSLLTGPERNICVVGDDAQSIYSFRGANIHNILGLSKEYPGLKIFKLERNYRSTQNIVNTANSLIAKNKEQIPKQVFSEKEQGNKVQVISAYSDFEEGFIVSNRIAEMRLTTHCDYNDFAVLYRTNAQSRVLEEALRKRNIPYRIYGGMSFYQRKEIKDAIAYFRLTINPDDEEALKRVINYPTRGIGNTTLSKLIERAHSQESSIWNVISDPIGYNLAINNGTLNKLKTFKDLIDELRYEADKKNTPELAETIIKRSGIWGEISSDRTPENISRQENIEELLNGVREFCALREEAREEQTSLSDFLAEISLATDQDNGDETEQDKVTLMTVHASKGLEFKQVFIVGVEEDLFPSAMSKNSEREIEEERRLLYVAITRAEENCTLTYALSRYRNGQTVSSPPSRFIKDLDSRYVDMPVQTKQESPRETISWNRFPFDTERPRKTSRWNEEDTDRTPAPRPFTAPSPGKRLTKIDSKPTGETHSTTQSTVATAAGQVEIGTFICHARFGNGTVTAIEDTGDNCKITVEFENVGRKQLLLKFAKFTIIE